MTERPQMKAGDTVRVHVKVREGDKERIQVFEGIVIGMHRGGVARVVHGAQGVVRPGCRAHLSAALADHPEGGSSWVREGAPCEALLPPRPQGQGCPGCAKGRSRTGEPPRLFVMTRVAATRTLEERPCESWASIGCAAWTRSGRGCLAGPVVAGAVVLHPDRHIAGLSDSKKVPAAEREGSVPRRSSRARWHGRWPRPRPSKSTQSTSIRHRSRPCAARSCSWRRCPIACWWTHCSGSPTC